MLRLLTYLLPALALLLAGCAVASPSATTEAPPTTTSGGCEPIELRTPSGAQLDLSGTWTHDLTRDDGTIFWQNIRYVRQFGSCVWWEEFDAEAGYPRANQYRRLFFGLLGLDFKIVGQFGDVFDLGGQQFDPLGETREIQRPLFGWSVWKVGFETSGGREVLTLEGPSRATDEHGTYATWVFRRTSTSTEAHFETEPPPSQAP